MEQNEVEKIKIKAVTTFNSGEAYVLDKRPKLIYTKYGNDTIIGTDGVFISSFFYERPSGSFYAFAGRKFDIHLSDGTVEHCYGQWWDGMSQRGRDIINDEIVSITACDLESLKSCYVFEGYRAIKSKICAMRAEYNGKIYGYWEYRSILNGKKPHREDRVDFRKMKNHKRYNKKFYA